MNKSQAPLFADVDSDALLRSLLQVSLTGVILFRPVYNTQGLITDLAYEHLNPAAQKMLGLPSRPAETFLTLFPHAKQTDIFAFYRDTFLSGQPGYYEVNYSQDGLDNYFHLSAQASGSLLIVSFTDTAQQDRSPVEVALRASQQRERENFYQVFEQTPAIIALLRGPQHFFQYCNPAFQALFPGRPLTGYLYAEVMPEIVAAGLMAELDRVYITGQTYYGTELPVVATPPDGGAAHERYYDFSYQAHWEIGQIEGISIFAYDVTERVQARQQAEAQRQRLHTLFRQAPAAICILDGPRLVFELVNPVYQQLFPGRSLLGKPLLEALPEIQGQPIQMILEQVYRTGETFEGRDLLIPLARQEGGTLEELFFNFIYQARFDEQGQADGILVFAFEVTAQVGARRQAEASEAKLRSVIAAAPAAIGLFRGRDLVIELPNQAFIDIVGKGDTITGKPLREAMPELVTENQPYLAILDEVYTSGTMFQTFGSPVKIVQNGVLRDHYYNFTYTPLFDPQGKVYAILDIALDVTEEIKARQRIEESEAYFRRMADNVPVMIWITQPDGFCTYLNQPWYDYTGQTPEAARGAGWLEATHPEDAQTAGEVFLAANQQQIPFQLTYRLQAKAGAYRWFMDAGLPKFNQAGDFEGYVGAVIDIHEQMLAQEALQQTSQELAAANEELQAANEEIRASNDELGRTNTHLLRTNVDLDNFIYTASHDLKAPISNIEGLLRMLLKRIPAETLLDERIRKLTDLMQDSVERFKQTITHLTEVVKLQKESNQTLSAVDLAKVVREVRLDLAPQLEIAKAVLDVSVDTCPTIHFSEKNLRSVIYNLLSNAVKYAWPDRVPLVKIYCRSEGAFIVLSVSDNGLGLDAAQQTKLFTMFGRLHDHVEGTGVGLYMIKKMVENAGGKIEVESQSGVGSTFRVFFPIYLASKTLPT